jgi:tRNA(Ile)-lysidine synthetase-like protein
VKTKELDRVEFSYKLADGITEIDEIGVAVAYMCDSVPENKELYCTLKLNKNAINGELIARSRLDGDTVRHGKMTKKVKKLMSEAKIPTHQRDKIPLICDQDGIVATPGIVTKDRASGNDVIIRLYK